MKTLTKILGTACVMCSALAVVSCGASSKGFKLHRDEQIKIAQELGESVKVKLTDGQYVRVDGQDGDKNEGKDVFFYKAKLTTTVSDKDVTVDDYFSWIEGAEATLPSTVLVYQAMYEAVNSGKVAGKIGNC